MKVAVLFCLGLLSLGVARAHDARCAAPPYGASDVEFHAYVKALGALVPVTKLFPMICEAKFGGADRGALYNLGITDAQIASESVGQLAVDALKGMKALADPLPDSADVPAGIYAAFTCVRATGLCYPPQDQGQLFATRAACRQYVQQTGLADATRPTYLHCFFRRDPWQP